MSEPRRASMVERAAIVGLAVLGWPDAWGIPVEWPTEIGAYAIVGVVLVGLAIDRYRVARALRAAADALDGQDGSERITIVD